MSSFIVFESSKWQLKKIGIQKKLNAFIGYTGFGFRSATSCCLSPARLRSLSATSCRLFGKIAPSFRNFPALTTFRIQSVYIKKITIQHKLDGLISGILDSNQRPQRPERRALPAALIPGKKFE